MDDGGSPNTGFFKKIFHKLPFKDSEDVTEEEIISMVNEGHGAEDVQQWLMEQAAISTEPTRSAGRQEMKSQGKCCN